MKALRIAFINELYGTRRQGGEQEAMFALADRLNHEPGIQTETFTYSGVDSVRLGYSAPAALRLFPYVRDVVILPRLGRFIAREIAPRFDIVHTCATTLFAHASCPIPVVTSLHAIRTNMAEKVAKVPKYWLIVNPLMRSQVQRLERKSLSRAAKAVVLKQDMADFLIHRLDVDRERLTIIPNPVDTEAFFPDRSEPSDPMVLFVGRSSTMKGIDLLIDAAPKIKGKIVVATRVVEPGLMRRFHEVGIDVKRNVQHSDMPRLYQQAQVFVLPSRDECQPLSVLEAMASGVPSVVTPAAASNLIWNEKHGLIIPEDPQRLAEAVNTLLANEHLRRQYGEESRQHVLEHHTWPLILEHYQAVYDEVLESWQRRS